MTRPTIIRAGNDPECVHRESVDTDLIGTCSLCGQVRSYAQTEERALSPTYGDATFGSVQASRGKGAAAGGRRKARVGSVHDGSAAWASLRRGRPASGFTPRSGDSR